jgi:hypothetical protein
MCRTRQTVNVFKVLRFFKKIKIKKSLKNQCAVEWWEYNMTHIFKMQTQDFLSEISKF